MTTLRTSAVAIMCFAVAAPIIFSANLLAADRDLGEVVADKLLSSTVTIRILSATAVPGAKATAEVDPKAATEPATKEVAVCSGVSLGDGQIVTFCQKTDIVRFRVTLSNGEQAEAEQRVVDHFSGLRLLEIKEQKLPGLTIADSLSNVGSSVWTAAAAGLEKPALSLGILSGTDRSLPGTDLPPLLQCDVRTTETSSGAPLVDRTGQLIGIVAATAAPGEKSGWTYAVPAQHISRMRRALVANQLVELKRQRPVAGLTIGPGDKEGTVVVERIVPAGPAEKAGLKAGDAILETDGRKIRSAYQAVELILRKQPGDKMTFVVQQGETRREIELTLGGTTVQANTPASTNPSVLVGPHLTVKATGGGVEVRNGTGVQELSTESPPRVRRSPGDEVELLKAQLLAFEQVIHKLQSELKHRGELQQETDKIIKSLQAEVDQLHKQLEEKTKEPRAK